MQLAFSTPDEYTLFVSSGDDAKQLRDLVDELVRGAVNHELHQARLGVRLFVDRWERTAARRTQGKSVNEQFVERAQNSSVTLCLVIAELRPGTREEIEGVLSVDDVDLAVVWFVEPDSWPDSEVGQFLAEHRDVLYVDRAGPPDGPRAITALVRLLLHHVLQGLSRQREDGFRERR